MQGLDKLLTLGTVADVLQVSRRTVERLICAGDLVACRVRGCKRVSQASLIEYQRRQKELFTLDEGPPERKMVQT
jgi:excisionase family DNA binding protein